MYCAKKQCFCNRFQNASRQVNFEGSIRLLIDEQQSAFSELNWPQLAVRRRHEDALRHGRQINQRDHRAHALRRQAEIANFAERVGSIAAFWLNDDIPALRKPTETGDDTFRPER